MEKPIIGGFGAVGELFIQKYERYLPTAFDESLTILQKLNKVIEFCQSLGAVTNDMIEQWNNIMKWVTEDGLSEAVQEKLTEWMNDGSLDNAINLSILKQMGVNVLWFKADNQGLTMTTDKIQEAIDYVHEQGGGIVWCPSGTYRMDKILYIYNDVEFKAATNAVFLRCHAGIFLTNGGRNGTENMTVTGYNGFGNIKVDGGTWDMNVGEMGLYPCDATNHFVFGHAKNIQVLNAIFKNVLTYHALDINGIDGLIVDNCKFQGYSNLINDTVQREAIQLGEANFTEFGVNDFTPTKNVSITHCEFDRSIEFGYFPVGVGNHYSRNGKQNENITVENNRFTGCTYIAVRPYKWKNTHIDGNSFTNCVKGVQLSSVGGTDVSAQNIDGTPSGIPAAGQDLFITNNKFTGFTDNAVSAVSQEYNGLVASPSNIVVEGNTFDALGVSPQPTAISFTGCDKLKYSDNIIKNVGRAFWSNSNSDVKISGNTAENVTKEGSYIDSQLTYKTSDNVTVDDNDFRNIGYNAIASFKGNNLFVTENRLYTIGTDDTASNHGGIYIANTNGGKVVGNHIKPTDGGFAVRVEAGSANIQVSNNYAPVGCSITVEAGNGFIGRYGVNSTGDVVAISEVI